MKKQWWLGVMFGALMLVLAACSGGSDKEEKPKEEGQDSEESAEGGELVIGNLLDVNTLDPAGSNDVPSAAAQASIYETLVYRDEETSEITGGLATEWEQVDELTWRFTIRDGVTFHDGEKLDAAAIKANLDRVRDPEVAASAAFLFEMITEVTTPEDMVVEMKTDAPFAPLLSNLSHGAAGIVSPKSIEEDYAAMKEGKMAGSVVSSNPVGTGPFKFSEWKTGDYVKLERYDEYWGEKAKIDSVKFAVIPEAATREAELQNGGIDISIPIPPTDVASLNNSDYASVLEQTSTRITYLGFNVEKEPFDNVKVRQAITYMLDQQEIIDGVYEGFGVRATGGLSPDIFGFDKDLTAIDKDVDKAKALMKEAGLEDGFKTTLWTYTDPQNVEVAVLLQSTLKEINIDVEIEQMEFGAYLEKTANGEHDMFMLGWSNPTGDADYGLYSLFHSSYFGDPGNRSFYKNEEVDKYLDEGRDNADPEVRLAAYKKAQELIREDAPVVFIQHPQHLVGISNKVKGFEIDGTALYNLRNVTIEK